MLRHRAVGVGRATSETAGVFRAGFRRAPVLARSCGLCNDYAGTSRPSGFNRTATVAWSTDYADGLVPAEGVWLLVVMARPVAVACLLGSKPARAGQSQPTRGEPRSSSCRSPKRAIPYLVYRKERSVN